MLSGHSRLEDTRLLFLLCDEEENWMLLSGSLLLLGLEKMHTMPCIFLEDRSMLLGPETLAFSSLETALSRLF